MKRTSFQRSLAIAALAVSLCAFPAAVAQEITVTGIELTAAPNAVGVRWRKPSADVAIDHYVVYYAKSSILENNGRFLGREETISNQTSLVLLDVKNRGLVDGETMYITVTAVEEGNIEQQTFAEEKSINVILPGTGTPTHAAAAPILENAVSDNETTIRLVFSTPMKLPEGHPAPHFVIKDQMGTINVQVLQATIDGSAILLQTSPMIAREQYTVAVAETVLTADGTALDPAKRTATFVARAGGSGATGISSSSASSVSSTAPASSVSSASSASSLSSVSSSSPEPTLIEIPATNTPPPDITPPEDVRNLTLRRELQKDGRYTVHASWTASLNTAQDLAAYHLYESDDEGKMFIGPTALLGTVISTAIANVPPGTFTLKVTAVDNVKNESAGVMETIVLPQTGAATLLLSLGGAAFVALRRSQRSLRVRT